MPCFPDGIDNPSLFHVVHDNIHNLVFRVSIVISIISKIQQSRLLTDKRRNSILTARITSANGIVILCFRKCMLCLCIPC